MFITKKNFNQEMDNMKKEYEKKLLDKDRQISMLETKLAMKELLLVVKSASKTVRWYDYGEE